MNNRKVSIIVGLIATVMAIVSIFVLFATAFGASDAMNHPSTLGSCFDVMFGRNEFSAVPLLIAAFVLQIVGATFMLIGSFLPGKIGTVGLGLAAILMLIPGIFWLMAPGAFTGINTIRPEAESVVAGVGTILSAVFSFLAAALGLYGAYRCFKD